MVVVGDGVEGHPESIFPISDCLNVPSYPEFGTGPVETDARQRVNA